jgi:hypothetical protein
MSSDAVIVRVAARRTARAALVGLRAPRTRLGRRSRGDAAFAVGAEAAAAIDAGRASVAILAAGIERRERTMVSRAELLPRQIERRVARVRRVLAVGGYVDCGSPELTLDAQVSVVANGVEEDPEKEGVIAPAGMPEVVTALPVLVSYRPAFGPAARGPTPPWFALAT